MQELSEPRGAALTAARIRQTQTDMIDGLDRIIQFWKRDDETDRQAGEIFELTREWHGWLIENHLLLKVWRLRNELVDDDKVMSSPTASPTVSKRDAATKSGHTISSGAPKSKQ